VFLIGIQHSAYSISVYKLFLQVFLCDFIALHYINLRFINPSISGYKTCHILHFMIAISHKSYQYIKQSFILLSTVCLNSINKIIATYILKHIIMDKSLHFHNYVYNDLCFKFNLSLSSNHQPTLLSVTYIIKPYHA
jgi:hypothetical protein